MGILTNIDVAGKTANYYAVFVIFNEFLGRNIVDLYLYWDKDSFINNKLNFINGYTKTYWFEGQQLSKEDAVLKLLELPEFKNSTIDKN